MCQTAERRFTCCSPTHGNRRCPPNGDLFPLPPRSKPSSPRALPIRGWVVSWWAAIDLHLHIRDRPYDGGASVPMASISHPASPFFGHPLIPFLAGLAHKTVCVFLEDLSGGARRCRFAGPALHTLANHPRRPPPRSTPAVDPRTIATVDRECHPSGRATISRMHARKPSIVGPVVSIVVTGTHFVGQRRHVKQHRQSAVRQRRVALGRR